MNGGTLVVFGSYSYCICTLSYIGTNCETYAIYLLCFPKSSKIETIDKGIINISDLEYGDYVKSYDLSKNEWIYSKFIFYLHKDDNIKAEYISIKTSTNKLLKLSKYHLIAINNSNNIEFIYANDLKLNDILIIDNNNNEVNYIININIIIEYGAYAPLLQSGTISVNNILASCYANTKWHNLVHLIFQPVIKISNYFNVNNYDLNYKSNDDLPDGVFWYAKLIHKTVTTLPFSDSLYDF